MRQFILPDDWDGGPNCRVEGGRARYVARVLRLGPGDSFPARDASGRAWACKVLESSPESLLLAVSPPPAEAEAPGAYAPDIRHGRPSPGPAAAGEPDLAAAAIPAATAAPRIILVQGLPKGAKMDLIVRQAAEAGVAAVVPLLSSRSAARGEGTGRERRSRWDRVVREALQQSGSSVSTKVLEPVQLSGLADTLAALGLGPECPRILFHEAPLAQSSLHGYLSQAPQALALCVGPEGGFAPDEAQSLVAAGFRPLRLAGAILRAETAALYAVAAAQTILSERSSWIPKPP
jgi:16S rRNA (uracil1498-N3)-methyltransferase